MWRGLDFSLYMIDIIEFNGYDLYLVANNFHKVRLDQFKSFFQVYTICPVVWRFRFLY